MGNGEFEPRWVLAEGYFAGGTPTGDTHGPTGNHLLKNPPFQSPFKMLVHRDLGSRLQNQEGDDMGLVDNNEQKRSYHEGL